MRQSSRRPAAVADPQRTVIPSEARDLGVCRWRAPARAEVPRVALIFENHLRDGLLRGVRKRQCGVLDAQLPGKLSGFTMKGDSRTTAGLANNFAIPPAHAVAPTRAQSLHRRFFRREARGVALDAVCLGVAIADFARRKDSLQKPVAKARNRLPDAWDLRNVNACADDHILETLQQPVATVNQLAVYHKGFGSKAVRFDWTRSVNVHHLVPMRDQPVRNQHAVAAEVYALGAHVGCA